MNTFLPYNCFRRSAQPLDWRRLQKQLVEGIQLCNIICRLTGRPVPDRYKQQEGKGWKNHPVLRLWSSPDNAYYLRELVQYLDCCATVWNENEHCRQYHAWFALRDHYVQQDYRVPITLTWGNAFHEVMRANLVRKDPVFYGEQFPNTFPREGYIWQHPVAGLSGCGIKNKVRQ